MMKFEIKFASAENDYSIFKLDSFKDRETLGPFLQLGAADSSFLKQLITGNNEWSDMSLSELTVQFSRFLQCPVIN